MTNLLMVDVSKSIISPEIVEDTLKNNKIDHLFMVVSEEEELEDYQRFGSCILRKNIIKGLYTEEDMQWQSSIPLDDRVLNDIAPYILQIFFQQKRFEQYYDGLNIDSSLSNHYKIFINNLSYFYNQLVKRNITHVFFHIIPHGGYQSIIYYLCKMLGLPTVMTFSSVLPHRDFFMKDFMNDKEEIEIEYENLKELYKGKDIDEIELEGTAKVCFENWISDDEQKMMPYYMRGNRLKIGMRCRYAESNVINLWRGILGKEYEKYGIGIKFVFASVLRIPILMKQFPKAYRRWKYRKPYKKQTIQMRKYYDEISIMPDYTQKYIYFPLHYQPEATTNPVGGNFYFDQKIPLQILSRSLQDDMKIYIKMHPEQLAFFCDKQDLKEMERIPNVRFIKIEASTYDLMRNSVAVASISGTACWECQFYGIPAILFGYSYKNITPLAYHVRTWEECKQAVDDIIHHKKKFNLKELKLYVKAAYNTSFPDTDKRRVYAQYIKKLLNTASVEK